MRKLILLSFLLLTGCISLQSRPYDPVEYYLSTSTTVNITRAIHRCNSDELDKKMFWEYVQAANTDNLKLEEFLVNKNNSTQLLPAVKQIRSLINETLVRGSFTPKYCIYKLSNVQVGSRILSRSLGQSNQFNFCEGGIRERFNAFENSYKKNEISGSEFKELTNDILGLEGLDTSTCDVKIRETILKDIQFVKSVLPMIMGL